MIRARWKMTSLLAASLFVLAAEGSSQAATWHQLVTTGQPAAAHNFTSTLGSNIVTLVPQWGDIFALQVLTSSTDSKGDYRLWEGLSDTGTLESIDWAAQSGDQFYQGIVLVTQPSLGGLGEYAGWSGLGHLYLDGTEVASNVTSFAGRGAGGNFFYGLQTSSSQSCAGDAQSGPCALYATSETLTTWSSAGFGSEQVTVDVPFGLIWSLDANGNVWEESSSPLEASTDLCAGGAISFTQIAAKGTATKGIAYGLSGGNIYVVWAGAGHCWTGIASPPSVSFLSIATDNSNSNISGGNILVWGSDQSGNIWYYQ
jgi:hypothetical protein